MNIKVSNTNKPITKEQINDLSIDKGKVSIIKSENGFVSFLKHWYLFLLIIILLISSAVASTLYLTSQKKSDGSFATENKTDGQSTQYSAKPVYLESPTNGVMLPETIYNANMKNRVLTAVVENLTGPGGARPQAGLQDADVVYEFNVEGEITRFLAVFWNSSSSDTTVKVQPIRSARKAFIDIVQEYSDALFMHNAHAQSNVESTNAIGAIFKYNIKTLTNSSIPSDWEASCTKIKSREHCLMTDTQRLWNYAKDKGYTELGTVEHLLYKDDLQVDPEAKVTKDAKKVQITFSSDFANYGTTWTYDSKTNNYLRFQGNSTPHLDQITKKQLESKVLVIQKTTIGVSNDEGKYHKIIKTVGSGDCWILQDGKATECTWKKDKLTSRTRFYDKTTNKELSLNRGKMWVSYTANSPVFL